VLNKAAREGIEYMEKDLPGGQRKNNDALLIAAGIHPARNNWRNPRGAADYRDVDCHHNRPTDLQLLNKQLISAANDSSVQGVPLIPMDLRMEDPTKFGGENYRNGGNRHPLAMGMR
jgi:hypothetical protein